MKFTKKVLALVLVACLAFVTIAFAGCSKQSNTTGNTDASKSDVKIGVILVGDETEGYTKAHMDGIKAAAKKLGLAESNIIWKYKVAEDQTCTDAASDLVASGCKAIFANSYGHETYVAQAAEANPDVTFVSMTGDFASICGLDNMKNAFTNVYESRYVSGVVAGLKVKELVDNGTLSPKKTPANYDKNGNIKIGYVGAYNYAEVVSGYTAFYLGIKSVVENVAMEVNYTNSWFDIAKEGAAAESLVANGCVIIGQHADSTGAPAAVEKLNKEGKICYSIGYNVDMLKTAPTAALTSATNTWEVYYEYAIGCVMNGKTIDTDWSKGYADGAVAITDLGTSCAKGTKEYVEKVEKQLKDGTLKVFDTSKFTVSTKQTTCTVATDKDKHLTSCKIDLSYYDYSGKAPKCIYKGTTAEAIKDGAFTESTLRSAPYFGVRIDGITEDA